MPKISIITPCYNGQQYIAETVNSVRAQSFTDWEHIIIDDGSKDDTFDILAGLSAQDARLRIMKQANQGKCATCNLGVSEARGEYIAILDQDDLYKPDKLSKQVQYLEAHPKAGMVYCGTETIDGTGNLLPHSEAQRFQQRYEIGPDMRRAPINDDDVLLFRYLIVADCIPMLTHLMRRSAAIATGPFDSACWPCDDWDFWIRFSRLHEIHKIPDVLASYRWHNSNFSHDGHRLSEGRSAVYSKVQADPTLSNQERQQTVNAIHADILEHASNCLKWGEASWRNKERLPALRYYCRFLRLRAKSTFGAFLPK